MAINMPIQGTAAEMIKIAMIKIDNDLKENNLKSKLILQIHDELLLVLHNDEIDYVKDMVIKHMKNAIELDVPVEVDCDLGPSWYEALMSYTGPKVHIDLAQLAKNYQLVRNEVGNIPVMATVKANGYGHGAVEVSKVLEKEGVNYFAVFTLEEGIELRDADITTDILVYSKLDPNRLSEAEAHNLTLNVSSFDDLQALKSHQGDSIKVHLKIDSQA